MSSKLSEEVRLFVVQRYAEYAKTSEIVAEARELFGVELATSQATAYDYNRNARPDKMAGRKWRALFDVHRERFLRDTTSVPIAQKSYRMREMQRQYAALAKAGASVAAASLLVEAEKMMGEMYTRSKVPLIGNAAGDDTPEEDRIADVLDIVRHGLKRKAALEQLATERKGRRAAQAAS